MSTRSTGSTPSFDIKKERRDLYAPTASDFVLVDVPEMTFLMVDGHGDPNADPAYTEAIEALFTASYAVRAAAKRDLDRVHTVAPLEGLWSADDPEVFRNRDKTAWDWTMMIAQPDWISQDMADAAVADAARKKTLPGLERIRFERFAEGRCVQILHVGSYDDEGPTLARLHEEFLPGHGLGFNGRHHEIYLSDARKTAPERLKTILRQPVR
jgi:hypothetical protein